MTAMIGEWVGKTVSVTLKVGGIVGGVKVEGKLLKVGEAGVMLEMPKGHTFIPTMSILHLSHLDGR